MPSTALFGAEIDARSINSDDTALLRPILDRLQSLQEGNRIETTLMSDEEKHFMWNLAFFFNKQRWCDCICCNHAIRSFITFHGIFMGPGYDLCDGSVWRKLTEKIWI